MDFKSSLVVFQGLIISVDKKYPFSKLTYKGGNEEQIKQVLECISKHIEDDQHLDENKTIDDIIVMRVFALYIVFNSDLLILEQLAELEAMNTIVSTLPTIPKYLMCEILWNIFPIEFVYEIIAYCCPKLSVEVADAFIQHMKYFSPTESLGKVSVVSAASYTLLCRLYLFENEDNTLSDILTVVCNNLEKCMNYFTCPPNVEKLNRLKKDEQYKYKGKCFYTMLQLIYECLERYTTTQEVKPANLDELYYITYNEKPIADEKHNFNLCDISNESILESLKYCHIIFLDHCKDLMMEISVDIFCAWSEFQENNKSMQETIGELCYKLRAKLLSITDLSEHPLVEMLQQIERKPIDYREAINLMDTTEIIKNINKNNDDKVHWIHALLYRNKLCSDLQLLNEFDPNLGMLDDDQCSLLFKILHEHLSSHDKDIEEHILKLANKVFQQCSNSTKHKILEEQFKTKHFSNSLQISEFPNMLTEIFNKVIASPDMDLSIIMNVFIQNPEQVLTKIFNLAVENTQQNVIMLKIMELLREFLSHCYNNDKETCIMKIIRSSIEVTFETEAKEQNLVSFISSLKKEAMIPHLDLFISIITPNMKIALLNKDIKKLNINLKLLQAAYAIEELESYRAPMLVVLAQVMQQVRWMPLSFSSHSPATLQLAIDIQTSLFDTYNALIPECECHWLKSNLRNLQCMNRYYYNKLWTIEKCSYIQVVTGIPVDGIDDDIILYQLNKYLTYIISVTTLQEWHYLWNDLNSEYSDIDTIDMIYDALENITCIVMEHYTENTWQNLLYTYKNFVSIVRHEFFKEPLSNKYVKTILEKISCIDNLNKSDRIEEVLGIFMPLLAYIAQRKGDYKIDVKNYLISNLTHSAFKELVSKLFSESATDEAVQ